MSAFTQEDFEDSFSKASPLIQKISMGIGELLHANLPEKDDKLLVIYPQIIEAALIYHMAVAVELRSTLHRQPVEESIEMLAGGIRVAIDQRIKQAMEEDNEE
jgi:hypothetical protein